MANHEYGRALGKVDVLRRKVGQLKGEIAFLEAKVLEGQYKVRGSRSLRDPHCDLCERRANQLDGELVPYTPAGNEICLDCVDELIKRSK